MCLLESSYFYTFKKIIIKCSYFFGFCFVLGVDFAFEIFFLCFSIPVISSISFCLSCCCLYSLNSFFNVFTSLNQSKFNKCYWQGTCHKLAGGRGGEKQRRVTDS